MNKYLLFSLLVLAGDANAMNSSSSSSSSSGLFKHETDVPDRFETHFVGHRPAACEAVLAYLKNPSAFERNSLGKIKTVLLHGLPGTGKTALTRVLAGEAGYELVTVKGVSTVKLDQLAMIQCLNALGARKKPVIVHIDEIDFMGQENIHALIYALAQEQNKNIFFIGETYLVHLLSRVFAENRFFNYCIEMDLPDEEQRCKIFEDGLKKIHHALTCPQCRTLKCDCRSSSFKNILELLRTQGRGGQNKGLTGSEINELVSKAILEAGDEERPAVEEKHFRRAYESVVETNRRRYWDESR